MLRDNLVELIEPMLNSAGANPLALTHHQIKASGDRLPCLENPRPKGAESSLTENVTSPFQAEPAQPLRRMNEKYGIKGCVHRLEQRRQSRFDSEPLNETPDHNSFDVEFSRSGQVLQETSYTYGGAVFRSTRFEYDEAERLILTASFDSTGAESGCSEL